MVTKRNPQDIASSSSIHIKLALSDIQGRPNASVTQCPRAGQDTRAATTLSDKMSSMALNDTALAGTICGKATFPRDQLNQQSLRDDRIPPEIYPPESTLSDNSSPQRPHHAADRIFMNTKESVSAPPQFPCCPYPCIVLYPISNEQITMDLATMTAWDYHTKPWAGLAVMFMPPHRGAPFSTASPMRMDTNATHNSTKGHPNSSPQAARAYPSPPATPGPPTSSIPGLSLDAVTQADIADLVSEISQRKPHMKLKTPASTLKPSYPPASSNSEFLGLETRLANMRHKLLYLLPREEHQMLDKWLLPLITSPSYESLNVDSLALSVWLSSSLLRTCAPMRDSGINSLVREVRQQSEERCGLRDQDWVASVLSRWERVVDECVQDVVNFRRRCGLSGR